MEFVPWAKVAKVASKVYDVGKSVFKMFKLAYNFMGSLVTAIERGLKTVLDGSIIKLYDNAGLQVGKIMDNVLTFKYSGFGGDIVTNPDKTTTLIGKWGNQLENIWNTGLAKQGEDLEGINVLEEPIGSNVAEIWLNNKTWLDRAISRGDVIRATANPLDINNVFYNKDGIITSAFQSMSSLKNYLTNLAIEDIDKLGYYGREIRHLFQNGYTFDSTLNQFIK